MLRGETTLNICNELVDGNAVFTLEPMYVKSTKEKLLI